MQNVSEAVGCSFGLQADTVACLRGIDFDTLRSASENITSEYNYQMQPRADGVVLPDVRIFILPANKKSSDALCRLPSTSSLLVNSTKAFRSWSVTQKVRISSPLSVTNISPYLRS